MLKILSAVVLVTALAAQNAAHAEEAAPQILKDCPDCPEMVVVPKGHFVMGTSGAGGFANERPAHPVEIRSFAIGKFEVTQDEWVALMGDNPSYFKKGGSFPVEQVSWDDIQDFIQKLNAKTHKTYHLPTEAEWEYAARGGAATTYAFGDDESELGLYAWFAGNSKNETHPVGTKKPNQFGLYDMAGNVWEWVQDCRTDTYAGAPADGSAAKGKAPCDRGNRGGSGADDPPVLRPALRGGDDQRDRSDTLGFRLARVLP